MLVPNRRAVKPQRSRNAAATWSAMQAAMRGPSSAAARLTGNADAM